MSASSGSSGGSASRMSTSSSGGAAASVVTRPPKIGTSAPRPDGVPKVRGQFAFSSDLWAEGMLWGHTLRSPHPRARIKAIDISGAYQIAGVVAVLTHEDVPGRKIFGLEHPDQPVLASDEVRYQGEPIAIVAADHPEAAKRAADAIQVSYEPLPPVCDPEVAITAPDIHPDGNIFTHRFIRKGDLSATGDVVVEGSYEVGRQDQAFMGVESGMALPCEDGGVELFISTQWLHADQAQIAACLALPEDKVRLTLSGVGGAFGAREDVSLQIHLCMLALETRRPVKMIYNREESFYGHVHRHPAKLWYRHHATHEGKLVKVEARIVLDGGAYASTTNAVLTNAICFSAGPYFVPNCEIEGYGVRTNNLPSGAMRGFGAVQSCYGHESQMDKLAQALSLSPAELRLHNALKPGDALLTGQTISGTAPVRELIESLDTHPLPADGLAGATSHAATSPDPATAKPGPAAPSTAPTHVTAQADMSLPGGAGRTADTTRVKRGVGFAVSIKNLMFAEGFDDYSTASCLLQGDSAVVKSACAEVGQGFVTLAQQIAQEVLGIDDVMLAPIDTAIGSAGSSSASRQTWMSGGAVMKACEAVRTEVLAKVSDRFDVAAELLECSDGRVRSMDGEIDLSLTEATQGEDVFCEVVYRHAPTMPLDENGQGDAHVSFAFAAHRAVVDVDLDLGLLRVIEIATTQDVGKVLNPIQAVGQIEGGIAQGVGLAVMEDLMLSEGKVQNASFTDYLIPTALDMPEVAIVELIEEPEPGAPFGAKGIGEPPAISSLPAVAAAVRNATGLELPRVPIRPEDIALASQSLTSQS